MTLLLDDLRPLIDEGESSSLEFKTSTAKLKSAVETLCAYLNTQGGIVLIGVNDSGKIIGQNVTDQTRLEIANLISKIEPAAHVDFEYIATRNNTYVIKMSVKFNPASIPYVFDGKPFWRVLSSTRRMPQQRYQQLLIEKNNHFSSWDALNASNIDIKDLDQKEIINTIHKSIQAGRLEARHQTSDLLTALRLLKLTNNGKLLNAAAVLFCKDPGLHFPQCLLRLVRFKGTDKSNIIDNKRIYGHAFHLIENIEDFFLRHMSINSKLAPGKMARQDIPDYPPRAIREAIINAISHRDYTIRGGSISVMIFDDRLEITSHGTLPFGITVNDLMHDHDSQPRNDRITQVMYRRGLIESVGTGTQEIVNECRRFHKPLPAFIERGNTFVVQFSIKNPSPKPSALTDRQHEIINILSSQKAASATEILKSLSTPPAERTLRDDLAKLKKLNRINATGKGRGTTWFLIRNKAE